MHAEARRQPHQRVADVVAVAEVREADALEAAVPLPDRHRVRERLQRMGEIREPVDHRDRRMLGERVDLGLVERADQERADEPREHERGVAVALAAGELEVGGGKVERHPAELCDPDLEGDAGAGRGLVEDHPDRAAGEDAQLLAPRPLLLQLVGEVERELELRPRPVGDPRVAAALEVVGDAGHADASPQPPSARLLPRAGRVEAGRHPLARRFPAMSTFPEKLNEQIAYEFAASQQYIAVAVHYDAQTLPQLAAHFYRQALEERNHAMMMVQYLLDSGDEVVIPAVAAPQTSLRGRRRSRRARARAGEARHGADLRARGDRP